MKHLSVLILFLLQCFCFEAFAQEYVEKVPKYKFSTTLNKQLKELEKNPTLEEFAELRSELDAADRWRPHYHFSAPDGKLNDPNGLCYWQGRWHMFYQAYPIARDRKLPYWGHAVSDDLIHWEDLPWALYPETEDGKIYSGTTLVEDDRVIAIHHTPKYGNYIAISTDPLLLNWERLPEPVVKTPTKGEKVPYGVFDPCIWKEGDYYYALSGRFKEVEGGARRPEEYLFRSKDLTNWEYMHPFVEGDQFFTSGDDRACPYFWPIGSTGKHILLSFSHYSGGRYTLGTYDTERQKFVAYEGGGFNHGPTGRGGFHAPSGTPDPNSDGVVTIFNLKPAIRSKGDLFSEAMTLPRLLSLEEHDLLVVKPFGDYQSLRGDHKFFEHRVISANTEVVLPELVGDVVEFELEIDTKKCNTFELDVMASPNKEEYTRIVFMKNAGYTNRERTKDRKKTRPSVVMLDTTHSSVSPDFFVRQPEMADVYIAPGETVKLHIFIDRSIIEVFVNDRLSLVLRAYPMLDTSKGVTIRAAGNPIEILRADAWQMKSIYKHRQ